ncbi:hypothetical protein [Snuella sedimenti]|uniref:Uncharacterized protein n=1 Tax=Snuella sedimenti TaxID=2798802 RepID=A0A8J7LNX5_9FLAO|nr:hypothetical protein [Snuella sedimenti]MBJ6368518.1 hypothetical protein [Snuella sedimenti]
MTEFRFFFYLKGLNETDENLVLLPQACAFKENIYFWSSKRSLQVTIYLWQNLNWKGNSGRGG